MTIKAFAAFKVALEAKSLCILAFDDLQISHYVPRIKLSWEATRVTAQPIKYSINR
jgi:hypothetical protein